MTFAVLRRVTGVLVFGAMLALATAFPAAAQTVATVNGEPITDVQVNQRLSLFRIEGNSTGRQGALEQLVTEAIQMQEATRLGISVSSSQIDSALLQIARNINVSRDRLVAMLQEGGVGTETLTNRLRAAIAWNAVAEQVIVPSVQISDLELDQRAAERVEDYQQFDYILREVIFVGGGGRSGEANRYRSSFAGCDSAVDLSLAYTDVAVVDMGRRHATQLPEPIARELAGMNVGGISTPRVVESGVSMLAICEKVAANDLTFIRGQVRNEVGGDAITQEVNAYLERLRESARIVYN